MVRANQCGAVRSRVGKMDALKGNKSMHESTRIVWIPLILVNAYGRDRLCIERASQLIFGSEMEWSEELNIKLIELLKIHPCLWDVADKNKKNRNKTADSYQSIAEELKIDVDIVKKRKETMFQTFRNYKRKVYSSKVSGAGTQDVYTPAWVLYPLLDAFLHNVYTPKRNYDLMVEDNPDKPEVDNEQGESDAVSDTVNKETPEERPSATTGNEPGGSSKKSRKLKQDSNSVMNAALNQLVDMRKDIAQRKSATRDESVIYGELVATRLSKLSEQQRQIAMHRIDNVLFEMNMSSQPLSTPRNFQYPLSHSTFSRPASDFDPNSSNSEVTHYNVRPPRDMSPLSSASSAGFSQMTDDSCQMGQREAQSQQQWFNI